MADANGRSDGKAKKRLDELDEFWELDYMLPEKKPNRVFSHDTDTVLIPVGNGAGDSGMKIPPREARTGRKTENGVDNITVTSDVRLDPKTEEKLRAARQALAAVQERIDSARARAFGDRGQATGKPEIRQVPDPMPHEEPASVRQGAFFQAGDGTEHTHRIAPQFPPLCEYTPENQPMISRVVIRTWQTRYTFYSHFREDYLRLVKSEPKECAYLPFFSFMPLPQQLSPAQAAYYLWFRRCAMTGTYPESDFSYILLLIYEIINLPDNIPPEKGITLLCGLWSCYRKAFPKLDRCLSEWVCDYCLIHNVTPDRKLLRPFYREILTAASFKEFYIGAGCEGNTDAYAESVFAYASNYNWRMSKFITPETQDLFEKHIRLAFLAAFHRLEQIETSAPGSFAACRKSMNAKLTRDSYSGALCAYDQKRRIDVTYKSCSRSVELRFLVTDLIKYAENHVRRLAGIKSRFHTQNLDPRLKEAIDAYFAPLRKKAAEERKEPAPAPEYERLYEAAENGISAEEALRIEQTAWKTTGLLTEAFDDGETFMEPCERFSVPDAAEPEQELPPEPAERTGNDGDEVKTAVGLLLSGDRAGFTALAGRLNMMPATLLERVNETAYEVVGDIAAEETGDGGYRLIEDYREDMEAWMNR